MEQIMILLPSEIPVLRDLEGQDLITDCEQYSIYYKNLIYPYREEWDIQVICQYGSNLGNMWRIETFPDDVTEFPFTIVIYEYFGKKLAEKTSTIKLVSKKAGEEIKLLCIGDSMTQVGTYIEYAGNRLSNIRTLGLRRFGNVNHEGRGGWKCESYFTEYDDKKGIGVSPFLFPVQLEAKSYFGNKHVKDIIDAGGSNRYWYRGFRREEPEGDMYCFEEDALVHVTNGRRIEHPTFAFSFAKYLERYEMEIPDVVSILFGANEFQCCSYENLQEELEKYLYYMDAMVCSVKQADEDIPIIINLPVIGSDQYAWGSRLGCLGSAKQYEHNIKKACEALIEKYDARQREKIYICPMLLVCSPETGFRKIESLENLYTDISVRHSSNWVHPCSVGYMQMGTALAGVIGRAFEKPYKR